MSKISKLISGWEKGTVKTSGMLKTEGISSELTRRYVQGKWIEKVGSEAYKLYGDEIDVLGAVKAMQEQMNKSVRIGGKSALELLGYSHFIPQNKTRKYIYGCKDERLPVWFKTSYSNDDYEFISTNIFPFDLNEFMTDVQSKNITVKISTAELALFEMLHLIPDRQSFKEAYLIAENMRALRPDILQFLFENCTSVKVKRLALFLIEENEQQYFKDIDLSKIYLGSGKRVVEKNGKYNNKYKITVPEDLNE